MLFCINFNLSIYEYPKTSSYFPFFLIEITLNAQNNQRIIEYKNLLKTTFVDTSKIRVLFELSNQWR